LTDDKKKRLFFQNQNTDACCVARSLYFTLLPWAYCLL